MSPGLCPVCGSELKPLFSSLQCFNDNCGKPAVDNNDYTPYAPSASYVVRWVNGASGSVQQFVWNPDTMVWDKV